MSTTFLDLAACRQSVRGYLDTPVEREKAVSCVEAARLSPSACNSQPWKIILVDDGGLKRSLAEATVSRGLPLNHFTVQAPMLAVLVLEGANLSATLGSAVKGKSLPLIDLGIAAEHFCLQAADLGLGTCMIGWFDEKKVRSLLGIPAGKRPILIITLGYPSDPAVRPKRRKGLNDIIAWNGYSVGAAAAAGAARAAAASAESEQKKEPGDAQNQAG
jgi:nitroreductase